MRFAFFAENKCGYTHLFSVQRYHMFLKYASIYDEKVLFSTYIILNMSNITFALRRCSVTQIQLMKQIILCQLILRIERISHFFLRDAKK